MAIDTRLPEAEHVTRSPDSAAVELQAGNDQLSLLDLLVILAERRWLIFKITAGFAVAAIIVSLLLPKQYTAIATVLPPEQNTSLGSALASQLGGLGAMAALAGGGRNFLKNPNDMFVAMMRSQTVEDAMIRRFGLMQEYKGKNLSDIRKVFESNASVDGSAKDSLLHISVKDKDPKRAAELANGWIDEFRKLSQSLAITEAGQRRGFFEQQLQQAKENLANAEEALKETQQATGMIQLDSQARALIESAAILRGQISAKEVQLQAMRSYATDQNSNVVQVQDELDSLKAQLAKLGGAGDEATAGLILPRGQVSQAGLEYVRRLRDVKYNETIFEILARQFEVAKLDEAKEGSLIQVVDPALPPDRRSSPKRAIIVIVATFIGFFLAVLVALVKAGLERMKQHPQTAAKVAFLQDTFRLKWPA